MNRRGNSPQRTTRSRSDDAYCFSVRRQLAQKTTGGLTMQKSRAIDYAKLLGFANLQARSDSKIDFKDKTIDARIGAKAGGEACSMPDLREMGLRPPSELSSKG
jgi:hypothetical protein